MRYNLLNQGVLFMKADATPLLKFIKDNQKNQLVIPNLSEGV